MRLARTADLLELAGTVPVTPEQQGTDWEEIRDRTRRSRAVARLNRQ
jgi:hypothetical protein